MQYVLNKIAESPIIGRLVFLLEERRILCKTNNFNISRYLLPLKIHNQKRKEKNYGKTSYQLCNNA